MIHINVYDFDGVTVIDTWHQPVYERPITPAWTTSHHIGNKLLLLNAMECEIPIRSFSDPILGTTRTLWGELVEYVQVDPRHFNPSCNVYTHAEFGTWWRVIEVNGMIPVIGHVYGKEGWVFERERDPFWRLNFSVMSNEERAAYTHARNEFAREHNHVLHVNVYDFDGVTVIDIFHQPMNEHIIHLP